MGVPDFQVIQIEPVKLPKSTTRKSETLDIKAPDIQAGSSSVLAFRVKPVGGKVKLTMTLKGEFQGEETELKFSEQEFTQEGSWHRVVRGRILAEDGNTLTVTKAPGPEVSISDVVLHFQTKLNIPR
jgi:hypothetical protein